jgi:hypothetical protein
MELTINSDIYTPSCNEIGNYVDKMPPANSFKNGIRCPCGTRSDKVFDKYSNFAMHIKTKHHQQWLQDQNQNKSNMYVDNLRLKELVDNQKIIIARLEIDVKNKINTIDLLTKELMKKSNLIKTIDLLDFD